MTALQIERLRRQYEKAFAKVWARELFKEALPILEALKDPSAIHSFRYIHGNIDLTDLFVKTWVMPGVAFANLTRDKYSKEKKTFQYKKEWVDDYLRNELHRYAVEEAGQRIVSIKTTNRDALVKILNNELDAGLTNGDGPGQIAMNMQDAIKGQYAEATRVQALRIARTEIVGSTCKGQLLGAKSLGYEMKKTWIGSIDRATRDSHKAMIGKSVGIDEDFLVPSDSGYDRMQHPGDARASAMNVCNCRCSVGFEVL